MAAEQLYNAATKEFALIAKNGKVVTYYKASAEWWAKQLKKAAYELLSAAAEGK